MSESMIQMQRKLADVTAKLEKAEAELERLLAQEPVAWFMLDKKGVMVVTTNPYTASYRWARHSVYKLFSAHVPDQREGKLAVAAKQSLCDSLAVSKEWRKVMAELADDLAAEIDQSYPPERRAYPSEQRKYEGEMAPVYRARTLLQSATQSGSDPVAHHPV